MKQTPAAQAVTARFREAMRRIPCPWGGCGVFPKGEVELIEAGWADRDPRRAAVGAPGAAARLLPGPQQPLPPGTGDAPAKALGLA